MFALFVAILAPTGGPFVVASPADERPAGKLLRLSADFAATIETRTGESTVKDVISLRREGRPLPPFPTNPQLLTASGDRIAGQLAGGDGQSLKFAPTGVKLKNGETWLVPLSAAAALWVGPVPADTPPDPAKYTWAENNKNRDVLRFRNNDTARGVLVGFGTDDAGATVQFRPDAGEARMIPAKDVSAVVFNPLLAKSRKPKGPFARVVLTDGSRLHLTNPAVADGLLRGEALFGQKVEVPLDAVVALDVMQGKATYLSDLKPKKVEQTGFLGVAWPWVADRNDRGTPLQLGGSAGAGPSTFDKGLGTHPRTVLTYDLGGKYQRFEALVGLDPECGDRGRAVVRVRVDGKEQDLPKLKALAAGEPVEVRVSVAGAKELALEVDFGPAGDVRSAVNWADARLVE